MNFSDYKAEDIMDVHFWSWIRQPIMSPSYLVIDREKGSLLH